MENREDKTSGSREKKPEGRSNNSWVIFLTLAILAVILFWRGEGTANAVAWSFFLKQVDDGNVEKIVVRDGYIVGEFKTPPSPPVKFGDKTATATSSDADKLPTEFLVYYRELPEDLDSRIVAQNGTVENAPADQLLPTLTMLFLMLPLLLLGFIWFSYRRSRNEMMGGGFLSGFSKSPAKRYEASEQAITFDQVAGLEGVKADLQEIVDFLKSPEKFQKLGGRVPKGVLLNGPPGTGKTLLARAIAGEANVPYFSVNGSEFIQMFVGVGASRVRDLFKVAKESSPSIIFIDEIDAVGRQRGAGLGGGHDEREQTLNQILGEMDGFGGNDAVIVVAATNRPDVLDPALLRPGRFDRHVTVGRPTLKGREAIFKVHVREVPLADDVNLHTLAAGTVGLTGADIRNMVNEAALWAARNNKTEVAMEDFEYARDKILMGAKREEVLQDSEKEKTAYHEAGHTIAAWYLDGSYRVHKVTIIPRGRSLGSTQTIPSEDRLSMSERELRHQLIVLLSGRAAERIIYDETTVGAENDLERATSIARRMVSHWGMSPKLGPVSYKTSDEDPFLGREMHQQRQFSEATQELIDGEVARILHEVDEEALALLRDKKDQLEAITRDLLEREELSEEDLTALIGPSVHVDAKKDAHSETVIAPDTVPNSPDAVPNAKANS
ncbi:ATP-dependent zinc metalloprotease FtsH [Rosistilla oblonga]|uniref:ATP-dependent zinc metalloprotease FtsH n=1 Tax=Rosistilla oblonga TaxID=2527990 RepID=A0A518IQ89_9BACT|nr:ATP-dependent zinc metalloprotease FtsH [Rosistilla oblonga]QDV11354.1 ATP-dependent zinc metalloprotease FtsH [Rosistilla oblonga]QDV55266.1 ATP-dependent zinc metalloprotease FtsH [Rosistilla oblonga]